MGIVYSVVQTNSIFLYTARGEQKIEDIFELLGEHVYYMGLLFVIVTAKTYIEFVRKITFFFFFCYNFFQVKNKIHLASIPICINRHFPQIV